MFDRIPSTKVVRKPAEVAVDYSSWRVVRFVLEHDGTVRYQLRLADANGNLAPDGFSEPRFGQIEDFRALLSSDSRLDTAAKVLFAALKKHAEENSLL